MKIYAMSDIHGCLPEFENALSLIDLSGENMLILLGDYVHGPDSYDVLDKIIQLQQTYGQKVIALMGNHEHYVIEGLWTIHEMKNGRYIPYKDDSKYIEWMETLPLYYQTDTQIFCHAGIDEDAGNWWDITTDEYTFLKKYPPQTGYFPLDIIAGHTGTHKISGNPYFHDIYYDGKSHYYIDGTVLESGTIPVLMYDTECKKYYRITDSGAWLILPYEEESF